MNYSFTGIRELRDEYVPRIDKVLISLTDGDKFYTGAAEGIDIYVEERLERIFPKRERTVIIPDAYHSPLAGNFANKVIKMEPGVDSDSEAFRMRNIVLVGFCDVLIAFPKTDKELFRGSGTWMTIRIARKAGKEVRIYPLEESE